MVPLNLSYKDFMLMLKIITAISIVLGIGVIMNLVDSPLRCASLSIYLVTISILGMMFIAESFTDTSAN